MEKMDNNIYNLATLIDYIDNRLIPNLDIKSVQPYDPVVVGHVPEPWLLLGVGNYAAALTHPNFPEYVVKIYAPGRPGIEEEIKVYEKIKNHPAYSQCFYNTENYLILKRLMGKTLYTCMKEGIQIPESVVNDIDEALDYARSLGLNPHDVHVKNVMMVGDKGVVVDISDFTNPAECYLWEDCKKYYYKVYLPLLYEAHPAIPESCLNLIRKGYRLVKKAKKKFNTL